MASGGMSALNSNASNSQLSSSPPTAGRVSPTQPTTPVQESLELQIDYWPIARPVDSTKEKEKAKGQDQGKNSVKSTFRNLQVWRLPLYPPQNNEITGGLTLCFATKEKKQKSKFWYY